MLKASWLRLANHILVTEIGNCPKWQDQPINLIAGSISVHTLNFVYTNPFGNQYLIET